MHHPEAVRVEHVEFFVAAWGPHLQLQALLLKRAFESIEVEEGTEGVGCRHGPNELQSGFPHKGRLVIQATLKQTAVNISLADSWLTNNGISVSKQNKLFLVQS